MDRIKIPYAYICRSIKIMLSFKGKIRPVISAVLLAVFCWHLCNVSLFTHTHSVDGTIVCHSHPYSGTSDNPGHSHSKTQLDTIAQLSVLVFLAEVLFGGVASVVRDGRKADGCVIYGVCAASVQCLATRGPPLRG